MSAFVFFCFFESVIFIVSLILVGKEFRDFVMQGYFLFLKAQAKPKEKVETSLAPIVAEILPNFLREIEVDSGNMDCCKHPSDLLQIKKRFCKQKRFKITNN